MVTGRLGRVGYELKSEAGNRMAQILANRVRKIYASEGETRDPQDGAYQD